jgi:Ca2+-binding EF-hand superfamily protein
VNRDEIAELMKVFNKLAHKGKITKESIKEAMKKTYGENYDASYTSLLFNLFDKDGSK